MIFQNKLVKTPGDDHSLMVQFVLSHQVMDLISKLNSETTLEVET